MRPVIFKKAAALVLAAALLFSLCLPVFADTPEFVEGSFFATGYTISKRKIDTTKRIAAPSLMNPQKVAACA